MRRWLVLLSLLAACGCAPGGQEKELRVGGAFGARPTVVFPSGEPAGRLQVDQLAEGRGPVVRQGDLAIVHYTAHVWDGRDNRLVDSSFARGGPAAFPVGKLLPGLDRALRGRRVGSRVVAAIPPAEGFGANPPRGVGPGDDLLYVIDILGTHGKGVPGKAARSGVLAGVRISGGAPPRVVVPRGEAPARFAAKVLARGRGPKVEAGRLVVTQYVGVVWAGGRVFDTTWRDGRPKAFTVGDGAVIKGWDRALVGVPAGSRVAMVVPPALGYGKAGLPAAGIRGGDTLVFVVDVLAAY
ncbi:FKBP-type peptidyl-prolyl cis-trans isomerase [Thermoactinospora rubra]|uniref:FKBP-type peptidyl-prolyl cis-trans isomerase n=1 Tax=Thermoactinospora rubra TaxID=1088767 RepID=UPI000A10A721|nr:FKBP-type peptidyl-prolyl cis-trans isomerase [Thermoactinospora rubra]